MTKSEDGVLISTMTDEDLRDLVRAARLPMSAEKRSQLGDMVRAYEVQHGMTSAEMRAGFHAGTVADTPEVASWLMLLRILARQA